MVWSHDSWKDAINEQNTQMARERGIETETDELGNVRFKERNGKLVPRDRSDDWMDDWEDGTLKML